MRVIRRLVPVVGLVLLSAAVGPSALAAPPSAPAPAQDAVTGSGTAGFYGQFLIDARSGPSGESPSGSVSVAGAVFFNGPVTCLAVTGNVAVLNVQTSQFGLVTLEITDSSAAGTPDVIDGIPTQRAPGDCSPFSGGVADNVGSGDIVVRDAPPSPTSKDQCKNGGFAAFGFRNQGQCVASVQRGGRG